MKFTTIAATEGGSRLNPTDDYLPAMRFRAERDHENEQKRPPGLLD